MLALSAASRALRASTVARIPLCARAYNGPATPSIIPEGTPIKGINYMQGGQDPVALRDEEYPEWLWTVGRAPQKEFVGVQRRSTKYLKFRRTEAIKLKNFMKGR
ncbi:hypothetical protein AMAG_00950 [Allomyces macrogynus ATCC 38327]|uniref:Large ribosomal subunit protein mL54 n=1 Tax=Allomyces macrogynus (strain ATCC 38327) TaxID=578462 RepID=A0A0L0RXG6_ALLM3|nr:hypothetical protein AMAG_00950 [Allomyces macrogynus ATCC 38327]|eukprot:KNE55013.1 hypothetical protein AMAG_00950 [Allomyces macrogynus ATCC 38327]